MHAIIVMIAVYEFIELVGYTLWTLFILAAGYLEKPLAEYIGLWSCQSVQCLVRSFNYLRKNIANLSAKKNANPNAKILLLA